MIHHFAKLGLTPEAGTEEIKASYRRLVKQFHPDMPGGNAVYFSQIKVAYDALSDTGQREHFARNYRKHKARYGRQPGRNARHATAGRTGKDMSGSASQRPTPRNGYRSGEREPPPVTRLMSIAMARSGTVVLDNLFGRIVIEPTTPFTLWDTTLAKFGAKYRARLARHVIQVRVTGEGGVARAVGMRATEYGVEIKSDGLVPGKSGNGKIEPVVLRCTVPPETAIHLHNTHGSITVGNLDNALRADLDGNTKLRTGRISHASLIMKGQSMALLGRVDGTVDALIGGSGKLLLDGEIEILRAVLENDGVLEVVGAVEQLHADLAGRGFLHAKNSVFAANCEVQEDAYVRIAELKSYLVGHRSGNGRVDVLKKPLFVPVRRPRPRGPAAAT